MVSIQLRARVGADGTLKLEVPTTFRETEMEVLVVLNPVQSPAASPTDVLGWPAGFFETTFSSCKDDPLARG